MLICLLAFQGLLPVSAQAFDPKGQNISVTIPFAPGGGVDATFKDLQKYAAKKGITLSPVFKPGAESLVGTKDIASGSKDGTHLGITTAGGLALYRLSPINQSQVTIITGIKTTAQVIVASPSSGIKNYADLKKSFKTGKKLTIGIGNPGQRLVWDQFLQMSEVKENPIMISYKGASQVLTDISGGHIDLTYLPITVLKPHIDSGNLVPILSTHTISDWPPVPTIKSIHNSWKEVEFGHVLLAPQGIDPVAVKYWTTFIEEYVNDQEVKKEFEKTYAFTLPLGQKVAEETITNIKPKLDQILKIERERAQNK